MKTSKLILLILGVTAALIGSNSHAFAKSPYVKEVSIYSNISESSPEVINLRAPTFVEMMDVNWRGGNGRSVTARIYADGIEVWSGMIPAFDPTFRATIRKTVSQIEIRVDQGSAYANWAKLYLATPESEYAAPGNAGTPELVGTLADADVLARQLVFVLRDLQDKVTPAEISANIIPLKKSAAKVFAVARASGNLHRADVSAAVLGLEQEFIAQEAFISSLLESTSTYEEGLTLMTIRERYKALFGSVTY